MSAFWKTILTIFLLYVIVIDANRARRRRQTGLNSQSVNPNVPSNTMNAGTDARQQQLPPNAQILNAQGQQQLTQGGIGVPRDVNLAQGQAGRQYYPNQNQQYNYGSQGAGYNAYGNTGYGNQYGAGQSGQYGQGMGQYGQGMSQYGQGMGQYGQGMGQYGSFYQNQNQNPSYGSSYSGSFGSNYNRPGYQSNYPNSGSNYGGYYWNASEKQIVNRFLVFLSSLLALSICLITI
ncbi:hypothetical protein I4U23_021360 [Adineta vaga]|nr:hypothetical protein I4U23_021360 [Adineta vaga]